ncbi:MAG: hypothetical protein IKS22_01355 [Bacteroidales bacterium]|nr:hypothetical protein [Bacteroidales bacterium]
MVHIGPMVYSRDADGTLSLENAAWEGGCILPGTGSDRVLYRITDHLGSVRAVRDGTGKVLQRFDYYPSGSESRVWTAGTSTTQSALLHRFGGKEIAGGKAGTAVHPLSKAASAGRPYLDFGARLYDPRTAAWLSQDPMAEKYYGTSPYAYCAGNPVNRIDPYGNEWEEKGNVISVSLNLYSDGIKGEQLELFKCTISKMFNDMIYAASEGSFFGEVRFLKAMILSNNH